MPGTTSKVKPLSAGESSCSSASDEVSQLELHLQQQLEEDIARIFDESIYSDLEVVCGKLKILTHTCILKARTHTFYHKLEAILHVNIGRKTFDEIYSFISDAYTECNIQHQEKEIIQYLNENLNLVNTVVVTEEKDETEVYSTPNGASPEEKKIHKSFHYTPSTELTKEYYAIVPIDGNTLDKELNEQDALSNALQSINKTQIDVVTSKQNKQSIKPTTLFLNSSHSPKINKHSNSCDILRNSTAINIACTKSDVTSQIPKRVKKINSDKSIDTVKNIHLPETSVEKVLEPSYSPDSLVTDEPSSSSDYLSAAYTISPGIVSSSALPHFTVAENVNKMDTVITASDSGFENTGMLESINSHKDVTLTDVSLTDSTFQDIINEETNGDASITSTFDNNHMRKITRSTSVNSGSSGIHIVKHFNERTFYKASLPDMSGTSTKEDKQRHNEEIVILESSSLSSEAGSWESMFPPKLPEKVICKKFITSEHQSALEEEIKFRSNTVNRDDMCPSAVQKSPFKSTSCFIDAASLADEGDDVITLQSEVNDIDITRSATLLKSSQPVPCLNKKDLSPNDWSESNDNDDSLEQLDNKELKTNDHSPTIFEMTPITEDSLCTKPFEGACSEFQQCTEIYTSNVNSADLPTTSFQNIVTSNISLADLPSTSSFQNIVASTPNNSMISVRTVRKKCQNDISSENQKDERVVTKHTHGSIISGESIQSGLSEADLPSTSFQNIVTSNISLADLPSTSSFQNIVASTPNNSMISVRTVRKKCQKDISSENQKDERVVTNHTHDSIISDESIQSGLPKRPSNSSCWVIDMSSNSNANASESFVTPNVLLINSKPTNQENSKSPSSVDSDGREKLAQKFYIDLSTLSEQKHERDDSNEKKNIFSMFIDLGNTGGAVKEMPARLSSSINSKKNNKSEIKCTPPKTSKPSSNAHNTSTISKVANCSIDTIVFEKLETLCKDPNLSLTDIINIPSEILKSNENLSDLPISTRSKPIMKQAIKEETQISGDLFVKLSDLDKPHPNLEDALFSNPKENNGRMTRSIPENDWRESSQTINSSSFHSENALSLNRLFPHLKNEFSKSMPGSLSNRTRSIKFNSNSGDIDEQVSDMSEMSSVQSSYCRSVVENSTTEETSQSTSLISTCQSRLGQDLLRMFIEEIATDVVVEVQGRRIKAHKCILSSRCQYFAGILGGGWVESAGNVIALPTFSFNVVHFALCHIYAGVSKIPDSISIVELATIADMLCLEGLKEVIMFTLKARYCHHFHKPCTVCTAGVLECFQLTSLYGLDDLYRKCLRWITKHFCTVWPTKSFATLPSDLIEKCCQEQIIHLTVNNLVETICGCGMTAAALPESRWSDTVAKLCRRVITAAIHHAAPRLCNLLRIISTLPAGLPGTQTLVSCIVTAIEWAPPDELCRCYAFLSAVMREIHVINYANPNLIFNSDVATPACDSLLYEHAPTWFTTCERTLVRAAPYNVEVSAFKVLPAELRTRLLELGCVIYNTPNNSSGSSPRLQRKSRNSPRAHRSSSAFVRGRSSSTLENDQVWSAFVPYAQKPPSLSMESPLTSDVRLPKSSKPIISPAVRTTKAQQERAKYNSLKVHQSLDQLNCKTSQARATYENTKPRYLEPRPSKTLSQSKNTSQRKPQLKVTASKSCMITSPILRRKVERRDTTELATTSQDNLSSSRCTLGPSTDSLSEPQDPGKFATYTKHKWTKSSVEPVPVAQQRKGTSEHIRGKTKIPVYQTLYRQNMGKASGSTEHRNAALSSNNIKHVSQVKHKEWKPSETLMKATKASQSKVITKEVKDTQKKTAGKSKQRKVTIPRSSQPVSPSQRPQAPSSSLAAQPPMDRSGTFLKDEPMFVDKTMNIDE